jgi:hypothetical protein
VVGSVDALVAGKEEGCEMRKRTSNSVLRGDIHSAIVVWRKL